MLTLKGSTIFEWSVSEGYTSLQTHSSEQTYNNMTDRWLRRLELVNNIPRNDLNRSKLYHFEYDNYDNDQFRSRFRLTKDGFRALLDLIRDKLSAPNERGRPIPADIQVLLTLRFYATGTFQVACGDLSGISQPSASRIIKCVSVAIAGLKNQYICFPPVDMLNVVQLDFWRIAEFPGVVGAIDCTHVKIPCPGGVNAELFRNRKGYFSINVQAVCGPNLEIQNIVARWPGSVHDARIFDNSRLCAQFERGDIYGMLLGDSGYPCRQYLLTPLADLQTQLERRYNVAHIRTQNTVEKMFGIWKRMFPCLSTCLRTKLETTLTIIVATAVLYNFVRSRNDPFYEPDDMPLAEGELPDAHAGERRLGHAVRQNLIRQHFT